MIFSLYASCRKFVLLSSHLLMFSSAVFNLLLIPFSKIFISDTGFFLFVSTDFFLVMVYFPCFFSCLIIVLDQVEDQVFLFESFF